MLGLVAGVLEKKMTGGIFRIATDQKADHSKTSSPESTLVMEA